VNEQTHGRSQYGTYLPRFGEESLLLGWKEKIKTLKNHEEQRDPAGDKKYFVAQSMAPFVITKL
jgi:hypothetical protein